mgnify:CR=1 FL=1
MITIFSYNKEELKKDDSISDKEIANFVMDLWSMKPAELYRKLTTGE